MLPLTCSITEFFALICFQAKTFLISAFRAGFTDTEIHIFFAKYEINVTNILSDGTRNKLVEDLELKTVDFSENAEQFQIRLLRRRIDEYV